MKISDWQSLLRRKPVERLRGDRARARLDWEAAEAGYRAHLAGSPEDGAAWIQLGHAVKEQDRLEEAEGAYRRALALRPDDLDLVNHFAHLLKRMGERAEAGALFRRLFGETGAREAHEELVRLGGGAVPAGAGLQLAGDVVFLEIDDLLMYLEVHDTVSGIQRVQLGVIQHVLGLPEGGGTRYAFVVNDPADGYLWRVSREDLQAIVDCIGAVRVVHRTLRKLVIAARLGAVATLPQRGQAYVALGAFWHWRAVAPRFAAMKRAGVLLGLYAYDLIPITQSEFCVEELSHEFALSFADGLGVFDFVLAISEFTAGEVRRYIERAGARARPVVAVPLAHANEVPRAAKAAGAAGPAGARRGADKLAVLAGRPYALMVSTIEARKNHAYLIAAWKQFLEEGLDPPDLVFVGRPGWRVRDLMDMLEGSRFLEGRVHVLHGLSDAELTAVYDGCLFTLFPSFVEGWGLPVGESLARGKPCVASSTSSVPEVGGALVDYLDPLNFREGVEVIRRMAFDGAYRDGRAAAIRGGFRARGWPEVSADLLDQVAEMRRTVVADTAPEPPFAPGEVFLPGALVLGRALPPGYAGRPLRGMLERGWYGIEARGCWMQRSGVLAFRSGLAEGTAVVVYLRLYTPPFSRRRARLSVEAGAAVPVQEVMPVDAEFCRVVDGVVGDGGLVRIGLHVSGPVVAEGDAATGRRIGLGLAGVGYALAGDEAGRRGVLERMLTTVLGRVGGAAAEAPVDEVDWDEY